MGIISVAVVFLAAGIIALIVGLASGGSSEKTPYIPKKEEKNWIRGDLVEERMPPREDPGHVIEDIYRNPKKNAVWVCSNCECENEYSVGSCCVCNHRR